MTTNWYISTDKSTWLTCASLGISRARLTRRANGLDVFSFSVDGDFLSDPIYAYNTTIYLASGVTNGGSTTYTIRFIGQIVTIPRQATAQSESIQFTAEGGWRWLEAITYQQSWQMMDQTQHTLAGKTLPRVILGQDNSGNTRSMGAEISSAVAWAITRGAPIVIGTIDSLATMPYSEHTNIPVAEVIRQAVHSQPDTVSWFEYSSGTPVFNCRAASALSAVNIPVLATDIDTISMTPRYDLQLPGITINYEISFSINGQSYLSLATDTAGSTSDPRAAAVIYPLQGVQADVATQSIVIEPYPSSLNDVTWWTAQLPWLAGSANVSVASGARSGTQGLQNRLVDGAVAPWMNLSTEQETFTALISYTTTDASGNVREVVTGRAVSLPRTSVSTGLPSSSSTVGTLTTNTFTSALAYTAATPQPTGLAAALYASWSRLHWDGSFRLVEQEPSFQCGPWCLVNLTGGRSEWTSMNALIPEITVDIDNGYTNVTCGTFGRLQADSLVAFWKGIHHYRPAFHSAARTTGSSAGGTVIQGANNLPRNSAIEGDSGQPVRTVLRDSDANDDAQTIDLHPAGISFGTPGNAQALTLSPRELWIPYQSGSTWMAKLAQVLASPLYGTAVALGGAPASPGSNVVVLGGALASAPQIGPEGGYRDPM